MLDMGDILWTQFSISGQCGPATNAGYDLAVFQWPVNNGQSLTRSPEAISFAKCRRYLLADVGHHNDVSSSAWSDSVDQR